ncbi:hypothetical protein ACL02T_26450 [Pseudonocardia sp. RS010]|uniref:hypothetical protein n=1 Tax=Pseudonocardia sp. RS010 TaxID=3385979 RepID=UPI0039A01D45
MRPDRPDDVDAPVLAEPLASGVDPWSGGAPTRVAVGPADVDTDADGYADTTVVAAGPDLLLHTDLDADGLADRVLRLGPGTVAPATRPSSADEDGEVRWWAPWTWFTDP